LTYSIYYIPVIEALFRSTPAVESILPKEFCHLESSRAFCHVDFAISKRREHFAMRILPSRAVREHFANGFFPILNIEIILPREFCQLQSSRAFCQGELATLKHFNIPDK